MPCFNRSISNFFVALFLAFTLFVPGVAQDSAIPAPVDVHITETDASGRSTALYAFIRSLTTTGTGEQTEIRPLSDYSAAELQLQRRINDALGDGFVLAYAHNPYLFDDILLDDDRPLSQRHIDDAHITPYTWNWIHLKTETGTLALRRPHWWMAANKADAIGNVVSLELHELGIQAQAIITDIQPSYIDTRLEDFDIQNGQVFVPVTGWFQSNDKTVRRVVVEDGDVISCTPNHPFYAAASDMYKPISEFDIGEAILLSNGRTSTITAIGDLETEPSAVFGIEVWRAHNYYVGEDGVLVHNDSEAQTIKDYLTNYSDELYDGQEAIGEFEKALRRLGDLFANDKGKIDLFVDDFTVNGTFTFGNLTEGMVNAWDVLRVIGSGLRNDIPALTKLADDIDVNPALESFLINNPAKKDIWELIRNSLYSHDIDVLNYADEIKSTAIVGNASSTNYPQTFFNAFPSQNFQGNGFVVHHAIEQQVLTKYPGLFLESELNSLQNLRGISPEINGSLHLSNIRIEWNSFYNQFPAGVSPTRQQVLDKATEIDNMFGNLFVPPIRSL